MSLLIALLILAIHGAAVVMAFRAIRTARTPQGAMGWTIFLVTFPYLALPLFLVLGHTRFPDYVTERRVSRRAISSVAALPRETAEANELGTHVEGFERMAGMEIADGNSARLLIDGDATFGAIIDEIETAERYVLVQFYILRDDELGRALRDALVRAAERGCKVRVLYDRIGSYGLPQAYFSRLREAGATCVDFHSIRQAQSRFQVNFRNHRKIVVVDGETAFLGGLNVGDEYMGRDPKFGHWRDTHLRLAGPVVSQAQLVFAEDWKWATEETLELNWRPRKEKDGHDALIVASGPADDFETGSLYFCNAIGAARRRVWIASPYFVPDVDIQTALILAAIRGVDVRILVADKRDHLFVWLAAFAYFDEMRDAGVTILRYLDGFMHQKVVLVDDAFASVGTVNLDNRSCRLNFEVTAVVFDAGFAAEVETMLETDFLSSMVYATQLDHAPRRLVRYGAPVARLLAPLL